VKTTKEKSSTFEERLTKIKAKHDRLDLAYKRIGSIGYASEDIRLILIDLIRRIEKLEWPEE
jgi:hypothetical protein